MSWSKTIKGSFGEVRNALQTAAGEVHDVSSGTPVVREAIYAQARVAVNAAVSLTAHAPFQAKNPEAGDMDKDIVLVLSGHANEDGSGDVGVKCSFTEAAG